MERPLDSATEHTPLIARDPEVLGGKPTLAGTRIGVHNVVAYVRAYHGDLDRILNDFPQLRLEHLAAALAYFAFHTEEIERILSEGRRFYEAGLVAQAAGASRQE